MSLCIVYYVCYKKKIHLETQTQCYVMLTNIKCTMSLNDFMCHKMWDTSMYLRTRKIARENECMHHMRTQYDI